MGPIIAKIIRKRKKNTLIFRIIGNELTAFSDSRTMRTHHHAAAVRAVAGSQHFTVAPVC